MPDMAGRRRGEGRFIRVELELTWALTQRGPIRGLDFPLPGKRDQPLRSRGVVPVPKPSCGKHRKDDAFDIFRYDAHHIRGSRGCEGVPLQPFQYTFRDMSLPFVVRPYVGVGDFSPRKGLPNCVTGRAGAVAITDAGCCAAIARPDVCPLAPDENTSPAANAVLMVTCLIRK